MSAKEVVVRIEDRKHDAIEVVGVDLEKYPSVVVTAKNYKKGEAYDLIVFLYDPDAARELAEALMEAAFVADGKLR